MLRLVRNRVKKLLDLDEKYRDSDIALMTRIWFEDFESLPVKYRQDSSAFHFLKALRDGHLTSWDSITRMRRKLQEMYPYLEGKTRRLRKMKSSYIKEELRVIEEEEF